MSIHGFCNEIRIYINGWFSETVVEQEGREVRRGMHPQKEEIGLRTLSWENTHLFHCPDLYVASV